MNAGNCTFHRPATKENPRPLSWRIDSRAGTLGYVLDTDRSWPGPGESRIPPPRAPRSQRYVPYFRGLPLAPVGTLNAAAEALIRAAGYGEDRP